MAKARLPGRVRWDRRSANAGILSKIKAYRVAIWSRAPRVRAEIIGGFAEAIGANNNAQSYKWYLDDLSVYADVFARIDIKAPVGTYEIDGIALDYCARGLLRCGGQVIDGCEATGQEPTNDDPVLLVRNCMVTAAYIGIHLLDRQSKAAERLKSHQIPLRGPSGY
jgi:hypothetical protein